MKTKFTRRICSRAIDVLTGRSTDHLKLLLSLVFINGCLSTPSQFSATDERKQTQPQVLTRQSDIIESIETSKTAGKKVPSISLETIMANPDWMGLTPQQPYWSLDSASVFYTSKRYQAQISRLHKVDIDSASTRDVELPQLHAVAYGDKVTSADSRWNAWLFANNIFVHDSQTDTVEQLTFTHTAPTNLGFLANGQLSYQVNNSLFIVDPVNGRQKQLMHWYFAEPAGINNRNDDYIAQQQQTLIRFVAEKRQQQRAAQAYQQGLRSVNPSFANAPLYFPKDHRLVDVHLSPTAEHAIFVTEPNVTSRHESDTMPNYINDDGRVGYEQVRGRVVDAKPVTQSFWLATVSTSKIQALNLKQLSGYNDDVLASVKRENAVKQGKEYQVNRLPRAIGLIQDWYWQQASILWNTSGSQAAVMLEAWDNKDRWLVTVATADGLVTEQHRLHDPAWINYRFNEFGWLGDDTLYFLSEHSGYSHIYQKSLNGEVKALTSGDYEVSELTVSRDQRTLYFIANHQHPGIYNVYRVALDTLEREQLTSLKGKVKYQLSPDQTKLLLEYSSRLQPPQLFVKSLDVNTAIQQLTDTSSQMFKGMPWIEPKIVEIASSNTDTPIYGRLYLPPKEQMTANKHKAVVFNHGAGYLQNAHFGWSDYFREFMFHSLLAHRGYVVLDMDYRASAGYGRDWRTAIYRNMGEPELQDLQDGVEFLVKYANVDGQRIGTYGGSYGGFLTFMAMFKQPDLFKAGAALRPVTDWAHYNDAYTSNILNRPQLDPIAYQRSSPIYFAEGLQNPLLINAPMLDDNVFFVDVVRLVQRLIELEKTDFETAIYPVEPHGFVQPSSWLDQYRRILKLFEENL